MSGHSAPPALDGSVPLFPLFADLRGRKVLLVGGGQVAARKAEALLEAGAALTVGAPALAPSLQALANSGTLVHLEGRFEAQWLDGAWLAVAATDDSTTNQAVAAAAEDRRIWCNVVDDAATSSFQVPSRVQRGPLQIAISTAGTAPMLARHLREQLEARLDESLGQLATWLGRERARIRRRWPNLSHRRAFFERLLRGPVPALLKQQQVLAAQHAFERTLNDAVAAPGEVVLVGAGPGDAGLLTLNALRALNEADVILHDRLVSADVLALVRRDAERIAVGKQGYGESTQQEHIHELLIEHARAGKRVVRLKGGDPFVFGRGGEELEALRAHGIAFRVVPGITAAVAAAAYAGIPLTHRDHAHVLHLASGHPADPQQVPDWRSLAGQRQTLAVYMGVSGLANAAAELQRHGRNPATPFALVENASRPEQRVITGPLSRLADLAQSHSVRSPALLIVGETAALAQSLHWFGAAPITESPAPDNASIAQAA